MKKKANGKQLLLSVEKLRTLQAGELGEAAGGYCCNTIPPASCKTTKIICSPSNPL